MEQNYTMIASLKFFGQVVRMGKNDPIYIFIILGGEGAQVILVCRSNCSCTFLYSIHVAVYVSMTTYLLLGASSSHATKKKTDDISEGQVEEFT